MFDRSVMLPNYLQQFEIKNRNLCQREGFYSNLLFLFLYLPFAFSLFFNFYVSIYLTHTFIFPLCFAFISLYKSFFSLLFLIHLMFTSFLAITCHNLNTAAVIHPCAGSHLYRCLTSFQLIWMFFLFLSFISSETQQT